MPRYFKNFLFCGKTGNEPDGRRRDVEILREQPRDCRVRLSFSRRFFDRDDEIYPVYFFNKFFFGVRLCFYKNFHQFILQAHAGVKI